MRYTERGEDRAQLWLRLEQLQGTVNDFRSTALVVKNIARHRDDLTLKEVADGLLGVHRTLSSQYTDAVVAVRQCLANDHEVPSPSLSLVRNMTVGASALRRAHRKR